LAARHYGKDGEWYAPLLSALAMTGIEIPPSVATATAMSAEACWRMNVSCQPELASGTARSARAAALTMIASSAMSDLLAGAVRFVFINETGIAPCMPCGHTSAELGAERERARHINVDLEVVMGHCNLGWKALGDLTIVPYHAASLINYVLIMQYRPWQHRNSAYRCGGHGRGGRGHSEDRRGRRRIHSSGCGRRRGQRGGRWRGRIDGGGGGRGGDHGGWSWCEHSWRRSGLESAGRQRRKGSDSGCILAHDYHGLRDKCNFLLYLQAGFGIEKQQEYRQKPCIYHADGNILGARGHKNTRHHTIVRGLKRHGCLIRLNVSESVAGRHLVSEKSVNTMRVCVQT
jgi:hypothetical protein